MHECSLRALGARVSYLSAQPVIRRLFRELSNRKVGAGDAFRMRELKLEEFLNYPKQTPGA